MGLLPARGHGPELAPRAARGRPRPPETDRLIRDAALELLRSQGPSAVNIDAVASRSGVARTTIYRRYRSRDELMTDLLDGLVEAESPAPTLPVPEKLRWVLQRILGLLEHGIDRDPVFTSALRSRLAEQLRVLQEAMANDVESGRLDARVDPDTLVGLLFGAYLAEVLRYGAPRPEWADRTVTLLAPAVSTGAPQVNT